MKPEPRKPHSEIVVVRRGVRLGEGWLGSSTHSTAIVLGDDAGLGHKGGAAGPCLPWQGCWQRRWYRNPGETAYSNERCRGRSLGSMRLRLFRAGNPKIST